MRGNVQPAYGGTVQGACWCCGRVSADGAMVHLGDHPEVGICVNCASFLARKARDLQATRARRRLRVVADSVRAAVMSKGWHDRPVIGPALMWLNRHSPW
jgi:hypothetical protein